MSIYREEELQSNISFFRRKFSETLDQAIDLANAKFNDCARTYFEIAVSYKTDLLKMEEELIKIRKEFEESYQKLLNDKDYI